MENKLNLKKYYTNIIKEKMTEIYHYSSPMEIPKIEKVVINAGIGDATKEPKLLECAINELTAITGQKPVQTKAKKSIATFKLREEQAIGAKVTLRGEKMWNFIYKLINIALPRVRDFRGIPSRSCDGNGNFTVGIKEQIIFTEIVYDQVKKIRGFNVTFCTTAKSNKECLSLLQAIGLPLNIK